jgi:hypothetical protein
MRVILISISIRFSPIFGPARAGRQVSAIPYGIGLPRLVELAGSGH